MLYVVQYNVPRIPKFGQCLNGDYNMTTVLSQSSLSLPLEAVSRQNPGRNTAVLASQNSDNMSNADAGAYLL